MIKHIEPGTNKHVMILLHGTGGNERDLVPIGQMIDEQATMIGLRGNVEEEGMLRFFERYPDGSFDLKSLAKETYGLYDTIQELLKDYPNHKVSILGYSNGANIALNLFKEFETNFNQALLFHPSPVREGVPFKTQPNLKVFMTSGNNDPFITQDQFTAIEDALKEVSIAVETLRHEYGHQLVREELDQAKQFNQ